MDQQNAAEEEMSVDEMLGWAEFCAWSALVMTPIIWWLQGASVSTDQFVMRTSLVVISAFAGVGLRIRALLARRRDARRSPELKTNDCSSSASPEHVSPPPPQPSA